MAESVEELIERMVPALHDLTNKKIFTASEVKKLLKKRKDFEYKLRSTSNGAEVNKSEFLKAIEYEIALECLRKKRSDDLGYKKLTVSDLDGQRRINMLFDRSVKLFPNDKKMWFQYIDFCLRSGATKNLQRVIYKALRFHSKEARFWLIAAERECSSGNFKAARALCVRGLRFCPDSLHLWKEYFRLEANSARILLRGLDGDKKSSTKKDNESDSEDEDGDEKMGVENEEKNKIEKIKMFAVCSVLLKRGPAALKSEDDKAAYLVHCYNLVKLLNEESWMVATINTIKAICTETENSKNSVALTNLLFEVETASLKSDEEALKAYYSDVARNNEIFGNTENDEIISLYLTRLDKQKTSIVSIPTLFSIVEQNFERLRKSETILETIIEKCERLKKLAVTKRLFKSAIECEFSASVGIIMTSLSLESDYNSISAENLITILKNIAEKAATCKKTTVSWDFEKINTITNWVFAALPSEEAEIVETKLYLSELFENVMKLSVTKNAEELDPVDESNFYAGIESFVNNFFTLHLAKTSAISSDNQNCTLKAIENALNAPGSIALFLKQPVWKTALVAKELEICLNAYNVRKNEQNFSQKNSTNENNSKKNLHFAKRKILDLFEQLLNFDSSSAKYWVEYEIFEQMSRDADDVGNSMDLQIFARAKRNVSDLQNYIEERNRVRGLYNL